MLAEYVGYGVGSLLAGQSFKVRFREITDGVYGTGPCTALPI